MPLSLSLLAHCIFHQDLVLVDEFASLWVSDWCAKVFEVGDGVGDLSLLWLEEPCRALVLKLVGSTFFDVLLLSYFVLGSQGTWERRCCRCAATSSWVTAAMTGLPPFGMGTL